jgi:hypothetical protein
LPVVFVQLKAAHSSLVVLSLGWIKGLQQKPMLLHTTKQGKSFPPEKKVKFLETDANAHKKK